MDDNINLPNKIWWDENPMTYINWDQSEREVKEKVEFDNLNRNYLDNNPYLKQFFSSDRARLLLEEKRILDIGTGWGSSALLLSSFGGYVSAIDLSDASVLGSKKNYELFGGGKHVQIMRMDAEKMDFPSNGFDFVFSWGVIHHSYSTETIVKQISRVLKPNGQGLVMVYNRHSIRYYLLGLWYLLFKGKVFKGESLKSVQKYFTDGYWQRHFSPREFRELLEENALKANGIDVTYMAARIVPGIQKGSVIDEWLKRKFGWLLVARFSKQS